MRYTTVAGLCAALGLLLLTGCVSTPLGSPAPVIDTVQKIRAANLTPLAVGAFTVAPTLKRGTDTTVSARGSTAYSPINKSFAAYLGETLHSNLEAAGAFDPASTTVISGALTRSEISSAASDKGMAALSATFTVKRDDQLLYNQSHSVTATWESSFMGVIAIPRAFNEYADLHRKLVEKLLSDSVFINACKGLPPSTP